MQIANHSAYDLELLVVLFAKICSVRLHDVKELRDHGGDAPKMAGADKTVQHIGEARCLHECLIAGWIYFSNFGDKDNIYACGFKFRDILDLGSGVPEASTDIQRET